MPDLPEHDIEDTRAALAPTLEATAAILPWVAKPRPARFDVKLNERWMAAVQQLDAAWQSRHGEGADDVRPAIFRLYAIALETADADCLRLGEALASAADRLEDGVPAPRLIAAMSATIECLREPGGLEHEAFAQRIQHFAQRLDACAATPNADQRSAVLDQLFVEEAREQIQFMREALAALPPDAYALTTEAMKLAQHAELLEIWGVMHLARQFSATVTRLAAQLDDAAARTEVDQLLASLSTAIDAVTA